MGGYGTGLLRGICESGTRLTCHYDGSSKYKALVEEFEKEKKNHNRNMMAKLNTAFHKMETRWHHESVSAYKPTGFSGNAYILRESKRGASSFLANRFSLYSTCGKSNKRVMSCSATYVSGKLTCTTPQFYDSEVSPVLTGKMCGSLPTYDKEVMKVISHTNGHITKDCFDVGLLYQLYDNGPYYNEDYNKEYLKTAYRFVVKAQFRGGFGDMFNSKYSSDKKSTHKPSDEKAMMPTCPSGAKPFKESYAEMVVKRLGYPNVAIKTVSNLYKQTCEKDGKCTAWTKEFDRSGSEFNEHLKGLDDGRVVFKYENGRSRHYFYLGGECMGKYSSLLKFESIKGEKRFECDDSVSFRLPKTGYRSCSPTSPVSKDEYKQTECFAELDHDCLVAKLVLEGNPDSTTGRYNKYWIDWKANLKADLPNWD